MHTYSIIVRLLVGIIVYALRLGMVGFPGLEDGVIHIDAFILQCIIIVIVVIIIIIRLQTCIMYVFVCMYGVVCIKSSSGTSSSPLFSAAYRRNNHPDIFLYIHTYTHILYIDMRMYDNTTLTLIIIILVVLCLCVHVHNHQHDHPPCVKLKKGDHDSFTGERTHTCVQGVWQQVVEFCRKIGAYSTSRSKLYECVCSR
jgi:hypothetical protein